VGLLVLGTAAFVFVQRQGLCIWLLESLRTIGVKIKYLEAREEQLRSLDRAILEFYRHKRPAFCASTGLFFLGWMAEALEVYVILYVLGGPAMALSAISIGALSVFIKSSTFFIPGSLGTQDGGNLLLLKAFGYSDVTGITFALVRRFRELVWIGVGLLCLAAQRRQVPAKETRAHKSGIVPDTFFLPPVAPVVQRAGPDRNRAAMPGHEGKTGIEQRQV
jgi:glycosyltransferase 2 family protein